MQVQAIGKRLRVAPRKARRVANLIKGKHAIMALGQLRQDPSNSAHMVAKVLRSAIGNAMENEKMDPETLIVSNVLVDQGMVMKRIKPRAMGRAYRILKRTSHITVLLESGDPFELPKSKAKPKARPKFESSRKKAKSKKEEVKAESAEVTAEESNVVEEIVEAPEEVTTSEVEESTETNSESNEEGQSEDKKE